MRQFTSKLLGSFALLALGQLLTFDIPVKADEPTSRTVNSFPLLAGQERLEDPPPSFNLAKNNSVGCLTPEQLRPVVPAIQSVRLDVLHGPGQPPRSCFQEQPTSSVVNCGDYPRWAGQNDFHWKASGLFSNPLYFEDVSLERYGQESCVQNAVSTAKFFGTVAILPYKMGVDCPREHDYKLGYIRPGNCAPPVCERLPFSLRGCAAQAGAVTGVGLLFP
jgi:hypothetical protein